MYKSRWFSIKILIFALPVLIGLLFVLSTAFVIGEAMPPVYFLSLPNDTPGAYQPTWTRDDLMAFKYQGALQRRPEVLLLGSSRGHHVRSSAFAQQPQAFYNASFPGASIDEVRQIVEELAARDAMPALILLVLDIPNFNGEREGFRPDTTTLSDSLWWMNSNQISQGLREVGRNWVQFRRNNWDYLRYNLESDWPLWGYGTHNTDYGYMADGSQYNMDLTAANAARGTEQHWELYAERGRMYETGSTLDEGALADLEQILLLAQEHGSEVIAYLPPYQQAFWDVLTTEPDFAYIPLVQEALHGMFAAYDYSFYDFSELESVGGFDSEMYDGWHPGEKLDLRILLALTEAEPQLLHAYVDPASLATMIEQAADPFFVSIERH
ncbi:MAG: hypothetical protein KC496_20785 [Anaerolineae bacterium]|nr:hypothetical protein [Anaerolineae bacterium]